MIPDSSKGVIRFSHTLTNVGNAYNSNSGAFTAPYDGDYMFIVRVDTSPDYDALMIAKNGHAVVSGHNDGRNDYHIVTCCVMTLTSGDTVTVNHSVGEVKGHVDGGSESLFVGFRIRWFRTWRSEFDEPGFDSSRFDESRFGDPGFGSLWFRIQDSTNQNWMNLYLVLSKQYWWFWTRWFRIW